ncbi:acyl-protein synthetase [Methanofollis formosanus]|uniref:Acyl-protein synthetase n=1 Tax=Methanofollis formosanus TaxID=299308 RepID=A0A8G1A2C8_9EURY|nr:acyl-protein synthetase [Methanofollis formosanus]QYZ79897.1 acyl-protein synthetase [Methanofollis formosanus]
MTAGPAYDLNDLLLNPPYSIPNDEKNQLLLPIVRTQLTGAIKNNHHLANLFSKLDLSPDDIRRLEDVPAIPVQMFKYFDLKTCSEDRIEKVLRSSGTTTGVTSRVPLSKNTIINQIKALKSILKDHLGGRRRIFLVIDHEGINDPTLEFSARTAGVRGLSIYAKKIFYLMREENGELVLNLPIIEEVLSQYQDEEVYVFGFTYIVWSTFYKQIQEKNIRFTFKDVKVFHSGGWKKLKAEQVSKEYFSDEIAGVFGTERENILDFYGMAEQTGIIFVDCECGNKHVPNFAQVIIRDPYTLKPCSHNEVGMIEVLSVLSDSYYSQAILTEDLGYTIGIDDCPCGRKGVYFRFQSRIEKVEVRGCGDTFRE